MDQNLSLGALTEGQELIGDYRLKNCLLRQGGKGQPYLLGELQDKSGVVGFVRWNSDEEEFAGLRAAGFARVKGRVERHKDRLQLQVHDIAPLADAAVDPARFMARSSRDGADMRGELLALINTMADPHLKELLTALLIEDGVVASRYAEAPAAISMHHPWIGGLMEHSLAVARAAEAMAKLYPALDRDLLVAGALLHDVAKTQEFSWHQGFTYTTPGNLVGHVVQGTILVSDAARRIAGFPERLLDKVLHLMVSHHGSLEHGAAKEPATLEAVILHLLDDLDAKAEAFTRALEQNPSLDAEWTEPVKMFGRRLYRGE